MCSPKEWRPTRNSLSSSSMHARPIRVICSACRSRLRRSKRYWRSGHPTGTDRDGTRLSKPRMRARGTVPLKPAGRDGGCTKTKGGLTAAFLLEQFWLIPLAAERHQQLQQADEQIVDAQEQAQCRHHVVGFAAVHNAADVIQDEGGENQHGDRRNGQRHGRYLKEQVGQR